MSGAFLRYGYCPLMLLVVNGAALWMVSEGSSSAWLVLLLLGAVVLSFAAERALPYSRDWNRSHGDSLRDVLHAVVNECANFSMLLALPIFTSIFAMEGVWPSTWPFVAQVLFAVIFADAGIALAHYASHRIEVLWRFHAVHHSAKRMYGFNGLMKHPVHQTIEVLAGTAPLIVMGLPPTVALGLAFCVAVQLLLQHSNVDYRVGPLRYVLAVNEVHRFHHQKDPRLGDVNFGLFTTLVDRALGTFHYEPRDKPFTSDELGIGAEPNYPANYLAQMMAPFRAR